MTAWWERFIGLPYKPHGRDENGLDCYGLVYHIFKKHYKIEIPSHSHIGYTVPDDIKTVGPAIEREALEWQKVTKCCEGDVIIMRRGIYPLHIGLALNNRDMIHIEKNINASKESYVGAVWRDRIMGIYRHAEFS